MKRTNLILLSLLFMSIVLIAGCQQQLPRYREQASPAARPVTSILPSSQAQLSQQAVDALMEAQLAQIVDQQTTDLSQLEQELLI